MSEEEHSAEKDAPEVCAACGAVEGTSDYDDWHDSENCWAHTRPIPPGERVKPKGECPGCHAMPFGKHSPDCTYVVEDEN